MQAIAVRLNADAMVVLREQEGKHPKRVFAFSGRPVSKAGTKAWRAALKRAGMTDFRWHDSRQAWAGWHVQTGTPLHILEKLADWESSELVRRYAQLWSAPLADYADKLVKPRVVNSVDTELAHA